jgi:hypothetical protein
MAYISFRTEVQPAMAGPKIKGRVGKPIIRPCTPAQDKPLEAVKEVDSIAMHTVFSELPDRDRVALKLGRLIITAMLEKQEGVRWVRPHEPLSKYDELNLSFPLIGQAHKSVLLRQVAARLQEQCRG